MRHINLQDPALSPLARNVHMLNAAAPIGFSSVERGGLRIASEQGLLVEGSIVGVDNSDLGIPAHLQWGGTAIFSGGLSVGADWNNANGALVVGDQNNPRRSFLNGGLTVNGESAIVNAPVTITKNTHVNARFVVGKEGAKPDDNPVWLNGLHREESAAGLRALAINSHGEVFSVPFPTSSGGGGGDGPGEGGDNPLGLVYPYPLAESPATGGYRYGPRESPGGIGSTFHRGIDWPKPTGTPVYCSGPGTVEFAGWHGANTWGNYIVVDHGSGVKTQYAHLSAVYVTAGVQVTKGARIGAVGSTGPSTGPHLHWGILVNGTNVDPEGYI